MRILGGLLSPFTMRAVLAARMKGFDIPVEMPEGGLKSPDYLALNPIGKMPTLVDGDFALPESAVIAEYLEEVLEGVPLLPEHPEERARVRLVARIADLYLGPALTPIFLGRQKPDAVPAALDAIERALGYMEQLRPHHAEWIASDEHSLADATAMPLFFFLDSFDGAFGTGRLIAERDELARWWAHAQESEHGARMSREMAAALASFLARAGP
jgi:glutathione S-transferase